MKPSLYDSSRDHVDVSDGKGNSKIVFEIEKQSRRLFAKLYDEFFEKKDFIIELQGVLERTPRLYYSVYSRMIYDLTDVQMNTLDTNLESLMEYTGSEEYAQLFSGRESEKSKQLVTRIIHKLWDHSRLAEHQITEIQKDNFFENFENEKAGIENAIKKEGQKLNKELITLVGIFTAMAFLVFGGLDSLSGILHGAENHLPVLNLSVICLLWGICVYNMIYLFMFLVAKLTDNDISTDKNSSSIIRRHLIYFAGNAVMLSVLYFAAWLYFLKIDFHGWYSRLYSVFASWTPLVGPVVWVLVVLIITLIQLILAHRRAKRNNTKSQNSEVTVQKEECSQNIDMRTTPQNPQSQDSGVQVSIDKKEKNQKGKDIKNNQRKNKKRRKKKRRKKK